VLTQHHEAVRRELARFRGREIDGAGDGFLAAFDGPARGILCAWAIAAGARRIGLEVRAGLHTGECEALGDKLSGVAVHIGARVASLAGPGEVLVSGSGLRFASRGANALKGIPGEWPLFAVEREAAAGA
jgi:class 3 adenylate cyclase